MDSERLVMTRRQVRAVDRWAGESLGVAGVVLMENAGRAAADVARRMLYGIGGSRVAVLAGAGANGGDGYVVARHLRLRGVAVDVYLAAPREKIAGDARVNLDILERLYGPCIEWAGRTIEPMASGWAVYDLLIDALGGTGITGELRGPLAEAVTAANEAGPPILALDVPTGLNCDTGAAEGPTIRAAETVTFAARKVGFDAPGAAEFTGPVTVADIGVPVERAELGGEDDAQ